jgi:hypothetical protein
MSLPRQTGHCTTALTTVTHTPHLEPELALQALPGVRMSARSRCHGTSTRLAYDPVQSLLPSILYRLVAQAVKCHNAAQALTTWSLMPTWPLCLRPPQQVLVQALRQRNHQLPAQLHLRPLPQRHQHRLTLRPVLPQARCHLRLSLQLLIPA